MNHFPALIEIRSDHSTSFTLYSDILAGIFLKVSFVLLDFFLHLNWPSICTFSTNVF